MKSLIHRAYEILVSTGLTIFLCMFLASGSIVGSIIYRGDTAIDVDPGIRIFSSPFFYIPALLLILNILFCVLRRIVKGRLKSNIVLSLAHGALILTILGLMIDGKMGEVYTGYFPYKKPLSTVYDWRKGQDIDLPFQVEVDEFKIERNPLLIKIGIKKDGQKLKNGLLVVSVGGNIRISDSPLMLEILRFDEKNKVLEFKARNNKRYLGKYRAGKEGSPVLGNGYSVYPVAFKDMGLKDMVAYVNLSGKGNHASYKVSPNHPAFFDGLCITMVESRLDEYGNLFVGFQMTRNPGSAYFWVGIIFFLIFITVHLIIKHAGRGSAKSKGATYEFPR